jgi:Uma2 family endonuclease
VKPAAEHAPLRRYNHDAMQIPQLTFESIEYVTQDEFAAWIETQGDESKKYELLNGRIVMNPPSGWRQSEAGVSFTTVLSSFVKSRQLGRLFGADCGFELPSGDTVAPDAAFVSADRWAAAPHDATFARVVPDLVVEVLSPSTASRDRGEKKAIYESNGVREYWLVDCRARRLHRFVLDGKRFGAPRIFEDGETCESVILDGLRFATGDVLP